MDNALLLQPLNMTTTLSDFSYKNNRNVIVRLANNGATGTGSNFAFSPCSFPTATLYMAQPVERLVNKALSHIEDIGEVLLPIDVELDRFVDDLVEQSYLESAVSPLTRTV